MYDKIDWAILLRYLNGEAKPEEEIKITDWMNSDKEKCEFLQFLEIIWQMEPDKKKKIDAESSWNRFVEKYDFEMRQEEMPLKTYAKPELIGEKNRAYKNRRKKITRRVGLMSVAACILISVVLFRFVKNTQQSESGITAEEVEYREIRTEKGQRTRVLLSDGSVIHLNGDSHLRIPEIFRGDDIRTVYLEGEAFFEIPKKEHITFRVITAESVATVLGTKFNVLSYPEDEEVTVVVAEGKVSLGYLNKPGAESVVVTENQKGIIGYGDAPTISEVENLSIYHGWTEGELVFEQEPLLQMIRKLERWYGIDIELVEPDKRITDKKLTASFSQNQPVDDVLQSISLALDLSIGEINRSKNKYKLFSQP